MVRPSCSLSLRLEFRVLTLMRACSDQLCSDALGACHAYHLCICPVLAVCPVPCVPPKHTRQLSLRSRDFTQLRSTYCSLHVACGHITESQCHTSLLSAACWVCPAQKRA